MFKNFRRTTQPTKIILHRNFISNAFTCEEDHEKAYNLVSMQPSTSILVRAVDNKTEIGRQQG